MRKTLQGDEAGFTMIETLLALALLLLLALPLLQWLESSFRFHIDNQERTAAALRLFSEAEELRSGLDAGLMAQLRSAKVVSEESGAYILQWRLSVFEPFAPYSDVLLEQVELTISWYDQWGKMQSYGYIVIMAR